MSNNIRQELKKNGLSQNWLSQIAKIPASNLSLIINGKSAACPAWRKRIADALHIPENELFPEANEESEQ